MHTETDKQFLQCGTFHQSHLGVFVSAAVRRPIAASTAVVVASTSCVVCVCLS